MELTRETEYRDYMERIVYLLAKGSDNISKDEVS